MFTTIRNILFDLFSENDQLRYYTDEQLIPLISKKLNTVPTSRRKIVLIKLIHESENRSLKKMV